MSVLFSHIYSSDFGPGSPQRLVFPEINSKDCWQGRSFNKCLGGFLQYNYSCVFGKRNYRVLVRVSVCVCVRPCLCVCVFLHDNSKRNRSRNTKSEYIVVYKNSSDEFDIELHRIKVKVTVGVQKFSPFTTIQTVRSYSSTLVQARNLILSIYLHLILIYKINECRHA